MPFFENERKQATHSGLVVKGSNIIIMKKTIVKEKCIGCTYGNLQNEEMCVSQARDI